MHSPRRTARPVSLVLILATGGSQGQLNPASPGTLLQTKLRPTMTTMQQEVPAEAVAAVGVEVEAEVEVEAMVMADTPAKHLSGTGPSARMGAARLRPTSEHRHIIRLVLLCV